ncbi:MAG: hypothetical protein WC313_03665 [Candidatus Kapaibacterium sp.]
MKKLTTFICLMLILAYACDDSMTPVSKPLTVRLINDSASKFSIFSIRMQNMGPADKAPVPIGDWSSNIIEGNRRIEPGKIETFVLSIPSGEWNFCRLGVIDSSGNEVYLHEQNGYQATGNYTITHWGSDSRRVHVFLDYDVQKKLIFVKSWSDFAE